MAIINVAWADLQPDDLVTVLRGWWHPTGSRMTTVKAIRRHRGRTPRRNGWLMLGFVDSPRSSHMRLQEVLVTEDRFVRAVRRVAGG
jgi:hypothetical protein